VNIWICNYISTKMTSNWITQDKSFDDIVSAVNKSGVFKMDPEHQRDVVHDLDWQNGIIVSALTHGDVPQVYFHTVIQDDGSVKYESLDGKQRVSAIVNFMTNKFKFSYDVASDDGKYAGLGILDGQKYIDFPPAMKSKIENCTLSVKIYKDRMSNSEITGFFLTRQHCKSTSLGEKLNASLSSRALKGARAVLASDIFDEINDLRAKKRYKGLEVICHIGCTYYAKSLSDIDGKNGSVLKWWNENPHEWSQEEIAEIIYVLHKTYLVIERVPKTWKWTTANPTIVAVFYVIIEMKRRGTYTIDSVCDKMISRFSECNVPVILGDVGGNHNKAVQNINMIKIACEFH